MSDVKIPEDVMDIARNVASAIHLKLHRAFIPEEGETIIARAILAEREAMRERGALEADRKARDLRITGLSASQHGASREAEGYRYAADRCEEIAQAIRSPHE